MQLLNRFFILLAFTGALATNAYSLDVKTTEAIPSALDSGLFYELIVAELNARGGEHEAAYALVLDAARRTNDARLYQRAVEIALQGRYGSSALQAAIAWKRALPGSREANRYVLQILIGLNRLGEALEPLKREVASAEAKERVATISVLPLYFARASDRKLAASIVEQALAEYLSTPALGVVAWSVIGRMRFDAADHAGAVEAARKAQGLDKESELPALLALSMMAAKAPSAESVVSKYLDGKPRPEVRMEYVRVLLNAQRYANASTQLQILTAEKPDYIEAWLLKGILELQEGEPSIAARTLKHYVNLAQTKRNDTHRAETDRGLVQAYLSLAQIAEQKKDFAEADAWLNRIDNADDVLNAQLRRAALLARRGKLDEARKLIHSQPDRSSADAKMKINAEVQLLREHKQFKAAYDLLAQATTENPSDFDLLYEMAMVADNMGNTQEMEQLLRAVIAGKPDFHHAYNALGYSLADRNTRLDEAKELILKALEFAPDDPNITDSLGWVEFRSGNLTDALRILQSTFKANPNAEFAAHLGEVLWTMGRKDEALRTWKEGLQLNAENETLRETLKRLRVKL